MVPAPACRGGGQAIPAGATITAATMTLNMVSGTSTANNADAYQVTGAEWTSASLQWSNKPAANIRLEENISHNNKTKYQFSCLAAVQHWYDGDTTGQHENYGIMLCYHDTTIADYNSVYSADCTDATLRPSMVISYQVATIVVDEYTVLEGYVLTLPSPDTTESITWSSSDTSVATVNSSGVVTGIKAGKVTITASVENVADYTYTVFVKISNGVYRIDSIDSSIYLAVNTGPLEGAVTKLQSEKTEVLPMLRQVWRITYLASGYYVIRPMHNQNMALHAKNGVSDVTTIGTGNTLSAIPLENRWTIEWLNGGYVLKCQGDSNQSLRCKANYPGAEVYTETYNSSYYAFKWYFETSPTISPQVLLLDSQTGEFVNNVSRAIVRGQSITPTDLGLTASYTCSYHDSCDVSWESSAPSVILIDSGTGKMTAIANSGSSVIKAKSSFAGTTYSKQFTVNVALYSSGTYCIMNQGSEGFLQVDSDGSSGTSVEEMINNNADHRKWILTLLSDGYYSIKSAKSGLALSIPVGQTANTYVAATLEQYSGADRQRWSLTELSNHHIKIKPKSAESISTDIVLAIAGVGVNVSAGDSVMQLAYIQGEDYADEWQICSPVHIGMSTDDYTSGCEHGGLDSYYYANVFYNNLLNVTGEGLFALTHHYNNEDVQTASPADFGVNGAISDDIDFMVYIGHGHAAHDSSGNHMHYDCGNSTTSHSQSTSVNTNTYCDTAANVYTDTIRFGSDTSDLRWVWLYTCNFLHTVEDNNDNDSNTSNDNDFVTNADLVSMMDGAHMVMGYASRATLCPNMAKDFAEYLHDGMPVYEAFLRAGYTGEASVERLNHYQKIVYIPQARYETIYSPAVHYDYDPSDVIIYKKNIQDPCVFS